MEEVGGKWRWEKKGERRHTGRGWEGKGRWNWEEERQGEEGRLKCGEKKDSNITGKEKGWGGLKREHLRKGGEGRNRIRGKGAEKKEQQKTGKRDT
jgi:hypothetical protein